MTPLLVLVLKASLIYGGLLGAAALATLATLAATACVPLYPRLSCEEGAPCATCLACHVRKVLQAM